MMRDDVHRFAGSPRWLLAHGLPRVSHATRGLICVVDAIYNVDRAVSERRRIKDARGPSHETLCGDISHPRNEQECPVIGAEIVAGDPCRQRTRRGASIQLRAHGLARGQEGAVRVRLLN